MFRFKYKNRYLLVLYFVVYYISCRPFDTSEWKSFIAQPSVPYVLKMLTGLCHWHSKTQAALLPTVGKLHLLEQVASDQHIGTLAENLLEAMFENPQCQEEVRTTQSGQEYIEGLLSYYHSSSCCEL